MMSMNDFARRPHPVLTLLASGLLLAMSGPAALAAPYLDVVISELMYHPTTSTEVGDEDIEDEYIEKMIKDADVSIAIIFAGRTYVYDGWIDEVDHSQTTDSPAVCNFTVIARPPRIF